MPGSGAAQFARSENPTPVYAENLERLVAVISKSAEIMDEARTEIRLAAMDMKRNRPSKFPLLNQLISEISDISSLADLKAENEQLLVQLGKFVGLAAENGWTEGTNAADALAATISSLREQITLLEAENLSLKTF